MVTETMLPESHTPPPPLIAVHAGDETRRMRFPSLDVMKAIGIVAVVWIHAFQVWGRPLAPAIDRLAFLTRFAVPAFFFASGFLAGRGTSELRQMPRRMTRILAPYLVASLLALVFRWSVLGQSITVSQGAFNVLTGSAWGIYYFVPMLALITLLTPLLAAAPILGTPLFILLWVAGLLTELWVIPIGSYWGMPPIFWSFRDPLRWWGYFFAGWVMAQHLGGITRLSAQMRRRIGYALLLALAGMFIYFVAALPRERTTTTSVLQYLANYAAFTGIFLAAFDSRDRWITRWLSEATYPIYLYHYFFIELVRRLVPPPTQDAVGFVAGCIGAVLVVVLGRRMFGRYAWLAIG